jgi:alpha-L-arabinofuranosidase
MENSILHLHSKYHVGQVDARLFGGFLEHLGRAVYEGVFDPTSAHADGDGFRTDVMDALRRLGMTTMRYPGGNFASGYHWEDGVGSIENRPTVRELAWQSIEPNHFGTEEYIKLCRKMDWTPMLTINLGTGTPEEARNWVEYCNAAPGTRYANLRATTTSDESHAVGLWCLGNEMDGPWQLGHVPAEQYAIRAQQAAKMMKDVDPSIELVVCGSSGLGMSTFAEWDRQVLEYVGDFADYISLHRYVGNQANDAPDFLAVTNAIDRQIEEIDAVCRFVQAKRRSLKRTYLCFDEWNVWYKNMQMDGKGKFAPHLIEEIYNLEDALVVAGFLHSFVRHADVVKIANLAQVVNVIAPILTQGDDLLIQSTFYPFEMFSKRRDGISLKTALYGPEYAGKTNRVVQYLDSSAILSGEQLHVFLTNRNLDETAGVEIRLADRDIMSVTSAEVLTGPDAKACNSFEQPDVIRPRPLSEVHLENGRAELELPPISFAAITFQLS